MHYRQIKDINTDLIRTKKAIIAIGCSFVEGQGAFNDELYDNYKWNFIEMGQPLKIEVTPEQRKSLLNQYPLLQEQNNLIDFTFMEYSNAFVNVLCKKYFNNSYTPINLGLRGCGNRGSITELYLQPEINWHLIEECIVIYCPSGLERFDFIKDTWGDHMHWQAMWPYYKDMDENSNRRKLWEGYGKSLHSEKFEVLEQLAYVQMLQSWCSLHNAKLIITPGFDLRYNKTYFKESLTRNMVRDADGNIISNTLSDNIVDKFKDAIFENKEVSKLVNLWPWESMFQPAGYETIVHLAMAQEPLENKTDFFFQFLGNRSPNGWMTPCAHPAAKTHDFFAQLLHKHIEQGNS